MQTINVRVQEPQPLYAVPETTAGSGTIQSLTRRELAPIFEEAVRRLDLAGFDTSVLNMPEVYVTALPGSYLGFAAGDEIRIDDDAAGRGWFVDTSPADDVEFGIIVSANELRADGQTSAHGKYDLLTTVMHELGHFLGLPDVDPQIEPHALMTASLPTGVRRLPVAVDVLDRRPGTTTDSSFLIADTDHSPSQDKTATARLPDHLDPLFAGRFVDTVFVSPRPVILTESMWPDGRQSQEEESHRRPKPVPWERHPDQIWEDWAWENFKYSDPNKQLAKLGRDEGPDAIDAAMVELGQNRIGTFLDLDG